jgi:2-dehydro-3-deoxyphosphogluconate aldolase / (4S)-4-hydroxy-2-oxoglutarate aldolase
MTKREILDAMVNPGVIAVIRARDSGQLIDVCGALAEGGVVAIELTMTTPDALRVISEASREFAGRVVVGVGTVLDDVTARLAILAGAQYVVTPVLRPDVIALCRRYAKPVVAGAYTPTEALAAQEAGADFVKIFPADKLGPEYIRALKAPLPQLEIIPTGGVDADTCGEFIRAGCAAVAAGGSLVKKGFLEKKDWGGIRDVAAAFVRNVAAARG